MGNRAGKIILLGDGTELLTDSDDTEMFDHSEEDKDLDSQVNRSHANANDDTRDTRSEREGTPAPGSVEASSTADSPDVEKTKSPQSYLNHTSQTALPTKLENPPHDK